MPHSNHSRSLEQQTLQYRSTALPEIWQHTRGRVLQGPFDHMQLLQDTSWGDGDLIAKLLGMYESELHPVIEQIVALGGAVINVGCAEGYYAVGLAWRGCGPVWALDTSERALTITQSTAQRNGVTVHCHPAVSAAEFQALLTQTTAATVVMDVEGAEITLLDPDQVPALRHCGILVESHDCIVPGITDQLVQRFDATHHCEVIRAQGRDPWQFDWLDHHSDFTRYAMIMEGRPSVARWIWMQPR